MTVYFVGCRGFLVLATTEVPAFTLTTLIRGRHTS
jgi:hypothetical protein